MSENTAPAKKESPKAEAPSSSEASAPSSEAGSPSGGKSSGAGARPISYFSSVSNDAYRAGWDAVFKGARPVPRAPAKPRRKAAPAAITLELDLADLEPPLRAQIEEAFRRQAKARRLAFDKRAKRWRLICELGG